MIVASMVATTFSLPSLMAKASAVQTVSVRPALFTCALAANTSPAAGARRFTFIIAEDCARFDAKKARAKAVKAEPYQETRLVRYYLRPFDDRWSYYTGVRPVWNEPRPGLW